MTIQYEADRLKEIPFSSIRQLFERVSELNRQGRTPVPFYIGQPDFDTPEHIKKAAKDALDRGLTAYTSNYGLPALLEAIGGKLARENGIQVDPFKQIIVTAGSNEAVFASMLATLNPGDEVLIPDPSWLHYFYCARMAGARVISVPLRQENAFQIDPDDLKRLVTSRTRMLVLNSPHNPTGSVMSPEITLATASLVEKYHLLLLSDEIYEKMVYDGLSSTSPASIEAIQDQTITINGFSKSYAMTGWRIGYVAASPSLIDAIVRVHQYSVICATSFGQAGALAALTGSQECVGLMLAEFARRRKVVIDSLRQIPGLSLVPPAGAFYAFPSITALGASSQEIADLLLEQANVAVVPGSAFGKYGEGFIRVSFACSLQQVKKGMHSIAQFCQKAIM
jgi:aspartate/methionine/tyrosine aminotransferase